MPVLNVPAVIVKSRLPAVVRALPSVQPPPTPLKVVPALMVTPFVVIVLPVAVEEKVIVPVLDHNVPATNVIEPRTFNVGDVPVANVTVPADTVISRHAKAPVIVTVYVPA